MRRLELIEFDKVADGRGNVGVVTRCKRRDGSGTEFLSVRITEGPLKQPRGASWGKLYHFQPLLDYPGGTLQNCCLECDRPFLSTVDRLLTLESRQYPKDDYCWTHRRLDRTYVEEQEPRSVRSEGQEEHR